MRRRIFWSILGVAAATGFLLALAGGVAAQRAALEATRREMEQTAREVATVVEQGIGTARVPIARLSRLLAEVREGPAGELILRLRRAAGGGLEFALVTEEGSLVTESPALRVMDLDTAALAAGREVFLRSPAGTLVLAAPVAIEGLEATPVVVLTRETPVLEAGPIVRTFLVVLAGGVVVAALLARFLSGRLTERLGVLSEGSRRLASGDLSTRVPDLEDPELAEVADSFNLMASEIEAGRRREKEFLLSVGHELRTPLTTLGGYAEALESGELEPGETQRIGEVIAAQTARLRRLIEDVTLLARIENPEFALRIDSVDVSAHLKEVIEPFADRAAASRVRFHSDIGETGLCRTDPDRLAQVVSNLLDNALRHTPEAGEIRLRVWREEDLMMTVADTGPGIDPEDLPHIFDRHYVAKRHRRVRPEGSGLGLAIVAGLVGQMGGQVEVESAPDSGTEFTVRLPCG